MAFAPRQLETHVNWRAPDVQDPDAWTLYLSDADQRELDVALRHAQARSSDLMDITREDFPLNGLVPKLAAIERELIDGRGFVRIRSTLADATAGDARVRFGGNRLAPDDSRERQWQLVDRLYLQRGPLLLTLRKFCD